MLADPNAALLILSDQLVKTKCMPPCRMAGVGAYAAAPLEEYERTVAFQRKVGEERAHRHPVHLVMRRRVRVDLQDLRTAGS